MQTVSNNNNKTPSSPVEYALLYTNSALTKVNYRSKLKQFFDYLGLQGTLEQQGQAFLDRARKERNEQQNPFWVQENIVRYLDLEKQRAQRKEITAGTVWGSYRPIKAFCDAYDDIADSIRWKRISKALPRAKNFSNDRAPTIEEIRRVIRYPDRRVKAIVYVMVSSGIRLGAWDYLRWKHVTPIFDDKNKANNAVEGGVLAAKLLVYAGESEEYYSFISPEAYQALKEWMDFRTSYGEKITGESWVMRNIWRTADVKPGGEKGGGVIPTMGKMGLATLPRKLTSAAIKKILGRALWEEGLRPHALTEGNRRHEWKTVHGYRKFFKTRAEQVMNRTNVEYLMGHSLGLSQSYYKPVERDVLADYIKAIPLLSIDNDNKSATLLQKQVSELTEKSQEENYIIKGKLAEKEKEIEATARETEQQKKQLAELQERQEKLEEQIAKRLEEKIATNYERLYNEVMRLSSDRLAGIKDKREREQEMNVLAVSGVEALAEIEKTEEQAQDTAIKEIEDKLLEEE
jgi:hypothetical protein